MIVQKRMPFRPHVIIIGGTSGTGSCVANHFVKKGCLVSVVGRRSCSSRKNLKVYRGDLDQAASLPELLSTIVSERGKWNSLVFVQRFRGPGDSWHGEWTVSVEATRILIEAAVALRATRGARSIVMFNSVVSHFIDPKQDIGYHVAKGAMLQLVRFYSVRLGPVGIRVNSISPATILKPGARKKVQANQTLMEAYRNCIPLGRMGTAEEMAKAAYFLASDESSYITGHDLVVDGGISILAQEGLIRTLSYS